MVRDSEKVSVFAGDRVDMGRRDDSRFTRSDDRFDRSTDRFERPERFERDPVRERVPPMRDSRPLMREERPMRDDRVDYGGRDFGGASAMSDTYRADYHGPPSRDTRDYGAR